MGWLLALLLEITLDLFPFVSPHGRWTPWIVGLVWLGEAISHEVLKRFRDRRLIERRGLSTKATEAAGPRFLGVTAGTFASDHCPVAIDINV